jgi:2-oxo-4-hydroxy-4-carboxy-5-ureidoimidazoline decarboxylase
MSAVLADWNELPSEEARTEVMACCGSRRWADGVTAGRPYASGDDLLAEAADVWWSLAPDDWLEAFSAHPRIGESGPPRAGSKAQAWSAAEQAGMSDSDASVRQVILDGNRQYEARFGYIYIVCASGKSADALLGILQRRLENDPEVELREAAEQQAAIMTLRLKKWLDS